MILTHGSNSISREEPAPTDSVLIGGRYYHYVQIGNQLWIDENLDYKFDVNGSQIPIGLEGTQSIPAAWYYNNNEAAYGVDGNKYGLLYNWYAAKYLNDNKSALLPEEWHVPSTTEWDALFTAVGGTDTAGTKLKSTTGWYSGNGDGSYDFAAFPAGYRSGNGNFGGVAMETSFWTSTETSSSNADSEYFTGGPNVSPYNYYKSSAYSVRLVKNIT